MKQAKKNLSTQKFIRCIFQILNEPLLMQFNFTKLFGITYLMLMWEIRKMFRINTYFDPLRWVKAYFRVCHACSMLSVFLNYRFFLVAEILSVFFLSDPLHFLTLPKICQIPEIESSLQFFFSLISVEVSNIQKQK